MNEYLEFYRQEAKKLIAAYSYKYDPNCGFKLNCGAMSSLYFNCKQTTLHPAGQYYIGNWVFNLIDQELDYRIKGTGGLTLGADAIATATAYVSHVHQKPIQAFIVRKAVKDHGTKQKIEGRVYEGMPVAVLDDVITTGGSTIEAIKACKENGLDVRVAIVLVDREELNGRENVLEYVPDVISMFKASEFLG